MIVTNLIKKSILLAVVFMSCAFNSFGQHTVSTTGGHFKSTGGSTSFTVGQVAYVLKKGNGLYLNKVVQEVYTKNILRLVPMFEIGSKNC